MNRLPIVMWLTLSCAAVGLAFSCGVSGGGGGHGADDDVSPTDDDASGDTWTDPATGLTWQATPSAHDGMPWADAKAYCASLSLAGGGWRLPTISELRTLIRGCPGAATGGACTVTDSCTTMNCFNDACYCAAGAGPNQGCYGPPQLTAPCEWLWSATPVADDSTSAWRVYFDNATVGNDITDSLDSARCVR